MVPVVDLTRRLANLQPAYLEAVARVLASGRVLLAAETEALEHELAQWSGHRHAVAVASGAGAIQLALAACGIGPGDEVIVPAFTAVPTASAVCALGAVPVPVDVEAATATLDPDLTCSSVTDRTKAVVPVHLYGRPCAPVDGSLVHLGISTVEDAAQAHGAVPGPRPSAAVAYSFYPTKNLGGIGDGGAVCTDDADIAARVRQLRTHGVSDEPYRHVAISQNFRMSELEAAWLRIALPHLAAGNERRAAIAAHFRDAAPHLAWQVQHPQHVYHLCVFKAADRAATRAALEEARVATGVHYPLSIPQQPAYRHLAAAPCPVAADWAARCVSVPCFPELTDDEVATVANALARLQH